MHIQFRTILSLALASLMIANPAFAQSIDLSPVQNLLQGIVDTITGPLGIDIGTLALIGVCSSPGSSASSTSAKPSSFWSPLQASRPHRPS